MNLATLLVLTIFFTTSFASRFVCYYGSWSVYRHGPAKFVVEDIDPTLCTHIIYTFVGLDDNGKVRILDQYNDVGDEWHEGAFTKLQRLRHINPAVKLMVAIGGWNEGSEKYSRVINDPVKRKIFVNSIVNTTLEYKFDGFDLDWEYPAQRGGMHSDKEAFSALIAEVKKEFEPRGLLLSAAVTANIKSAPESYNCKHLAQYLDFINVMTYDLHGGWSKKIGHHTAMYQHPSDSDEELHLNVNSAMKFWVECTGAPEKLNIGLASYGRTFTLKDPSKHDIGSPATGPGSPGQYVGESGFLGYNEICKEQMSNLWSVYHVKEQDVEYAVKRNIWVGYDDPESITRKVNYARRLGVGGAMIWSIETDDFRGECGRGKYPLLRAALAALNIPIPPPQLPSTTMSTTKAPAPSTSSTSSSVWTTRPSTWWSTKPTTWSTKPPYSSTNPPSWTKPTHSPHGDYDDLCLYVGHIFKHPRNSSAFFICTYSGIGNQLKAVLVKCPPKLEFNEETHVCDYKFNSKSVNNFYYSGNFNDLF